MSSLTTLYILNERGDAEPCHDPLAWGRWFEQASRDGTRVIGSDRDEGLGVADVWVSTVFLGIDHDYTTAGPPVLWETLVFGGPLDGEMLRYISRMDALAGHQEMCLRVRAANLEQK